MHLLVKTDGSVTYGLMNLGSYIVGRYEGDFIIENEHVSLIQCELMVVNHEPYVQHLALSNDTLLNGEALPLGEFRPLRVGSTLQFGSGPIFRLHKDVKRVTFSCLTPEDVELCEELMEEFNYPIEKDWTPAVTHIIVPMFIFTKKVMCGLIEKNCIVTLDYFKILSVKVKRHTNLLGSAETDFYPAPFQTNVPVNIDLDRKTLFKNKLFIFSNIREYNDLKTVVNLAGGRAICVEEHAFNKMNIDDSEVDTLLIVTDQWIPVSKDHFTDLVFYLLRRGRRTIPLIEIGGAVGANSTEMYCNSYFKHLPPPPSPAKKGHRSPSSDEQSKSENTKRAKKEK